MKVSARLVFIFLIAGHAGVTWGSDACSGRAILTVADVAVSDGSSFKTESYFHSKDAAAIRHIRDDEQIVAVEGPLSWISSGDKSQLGSGFFKVFALGHQYHAFLLHFDEIVANSRVTERLDFRGNVHRALSGDYPYGGTVHLVEGAAQERPLGLLFEFPGSAAIAVSFSDWRNAGDAELPFRAEIDDGERVFDYRYSSIDTVPRLPLWFFETVTAPPLDQVQVYRLHRKLLAAHCLGDAELLSGLSAPEVISASNGELQQTPNESVRERFAALFERLDYSGYHDIAVPIIEIAESADLGWIGANVRAVGLDSSTGAPFDNQWAWFMIVRKIDGRWLHVGNASNFAR
jgi:ketosteroid isomerase-like protein